MDDIEVWSVNVAQEEALRLLETSLTSKSALTTAFINSSNIDIKIPKQLYLKSCWTLNGSAPRRYAHTPRQVQDSHILEGHGGEYAEPHTSVGGGLCKRSAIGAILRQDFAYE
ncbi:hypothetical protein GIB67_007663 [Kingdonia uniflora]|uniref:Uncharacterized protein n=1 Tax=Kingdonia uniflora TaxID=39325 RepID=A0A7J7N1X3_9MAGN|nr:hypothetical protein GIB67_007663 [Kingdonia uniflora]